MGDTEDAGEDGDNNDDPADEVVEPAEEAKKPTKKSPTPRKGLGAPRKPLAKKATEKEDEQTGDKDEEEPKKEVKKTARSALKKAPAAKKAPGAKKAPAAKKAPTVKKAPATKKATTKKSPTRKSPTKKKTSLGKRKNDDEGSDDIIDPIDPSERGEIINTPRKKPKFTKGETLKGAICASAVTLEVILPLLTDRHHASHPLASLGYSENLHSNVNHLIIGEKKRTAKVLTAIASGIWVVKYQWFLDSMDAGKFWMRKSMKRMIGFLVVKLLENERKKENLVCS